jgi:hypothetical protein
VIPFPLHRNHNPWHCDTMLYLVTIRRDRRDASKHRILITFTFTLALSVLLTDGVVEVHLMSVIRETMLSVLTIGLAEITPVGPGEHTKTRTMLLLR